MDDRPCREFFLEPQETLQRRYEALRAIFVSGEPLVRVAERFGYKVAALKSVVSRFRADRRRGVTPPFFCTTVEDDLPANDTPRTKTGPRCRRSPTADN
jgi:hypothetical protein